MFITKRYLRWEDLSFKESIICFAFEISKG